MSIYKRLFFWLNGIGRNHNRFQFDGIFLLQATREPQVTKRENDMNAASLAFNSYQRFLSVKTNDCEIS